MGTTLTPETNYITFGQFILFSIFFSSLLEDFLKIFLVCFVFSPLKVSELTSAQNNCNQRKCYRSVISKAQFLM